MAEVYNIKQQLSGSSPVMDATKGNWAFIQAPVGNVALTITARWVGDEGKLWFKQDSVGARTLTINGTYSVLVNPDADSVTTIEWGYNGTEWGFIPSFKGATGGGGGTVNNPPTVSLAASSTSVNEGDNVTLTANASDSDGTISKVEFYENSTLLGSVSVAPYVWNITGITAGTHSYTAMAYDNGNATANSASVIVSTIPIIAAPTDLTAGSTSSTQITLHWTDNSNNEDGFSIERRTGLNGTWAEVGTVAAGVVTYIDNSVAQNNKYYYRVRAKQTAYYSEYSNIAQSAIVWAYNFDGTNDYLSIPHSTALNLERTDSFSIECWVKIPSVTTGAVKRLFTKYDTATSRGIVLAIPTNGKLTFILSNGASNVLNVTIPLPDSQTSLVAQNNKWYHFIVTYDGTSAVSGVKFYIDGKLVTKTLTTVTASLTATIQNTQPVYIGTLSATSGWSAHYQAVTRVFNKTLNTSEVTTLYNAGLPLYSTSITNKVLEVLVNNDTYSGSNFTVMESANSNNGTSSGMVLNQKVLVNDIDAISAINIQPFADGSASLYYDTFNNAGGDDPTALMNSPFTDRRTNVYYDAATDRTYLAWMQKGYLGWNRESMLMYVDHTDRFASPSFEADYLTAGVIDGHPAPSIIGTPDNEILLVHENIHISPLYFKKTTGKAPERLHLVSQTDASVTLSYPTFFKIGTTIYIYGRSGGGAEFSRDYITKSTDSGATWTVPSRVVDLFDNTGEDRAYFVPIYDPNKIRMLIAMREGSNVTFTRLYYIESTDGINWKNYSGTFTKDITTGAITRSFMDANYAILYDNENDIHPKAAVLTPAGNVVFLADDTVNHYRFVSYNGSAWVSKPVNMPLYVGHNTTNTSSLDYWVVYPYSDIHFVAFRIETRNSYDVVVKYETFDAFSTWDAGTIVSDTVQKHEQLQGTHNWTAGKMLIACNQVGATYNKIFLYEWIP